MKRAAYLGLILVCKRPWCRCTVTFNSRFRDELMDRPSSYSSVWQTLVGSSIAGGSITTTIVPTVPWITKPQRPSPPAMLLPLRRELRLRLSTLLRSSRQRSSPNPNLHSNRYRNLMQASFSPLWLRDAPACRHRRSRVSRGVGRFLGRLWE